MAIIRPYNEKNIIYTKDDINNLFEDYTDSNGQSFKVSPLQYNSDGEINWHKYIVQYDGDGSVYVSIAHYYNDNIDTAMNPNTPFRRTGPRKVQSDIEYIDSTQYRGEKAAWLVFRTEGDVDIKRIDHHYWRGENTLYGHEPYEFSYKGGTLLYRLMFPKNYDSTSDKKYPLVISVSGSGGVGINNKKQMEMVIFGRYLFTKYYQNPEFECISIVPQIGYGDFIPYPYYPHVRTPITGGPTSIYHPDWPSVNENGFYSDACKALFYSLIENEDYAIDENRIYYTGFSYGGKGGFEFMKSMRELWAGAYFVAGWPIYTAYYNINRLNQEMQDKLRKRLAEEISRWNHIPVILSAGSADGMRHGMREAHEELTKQGGVSQLYISGSESNPVSHVSSAGYAWANFENVKWLFHQNKIINPVPGPDPYPNGIYIDTKSSSSSESTNSSSSRVQEESSSSSFGPYEDINDILKGDANLDGRVDYSDYVILMDHYGTTDGATWKQGDFNFDGAVDQKDVSWMEMMFGRELDSLNDEGTISSESSIFSNSSESSSSISDESFSSNSSYTSLSSESDQSSLSSDSTNSSDTSKTSTSSEWSWNIPSHYISDNEWLDSGTILDTWYNDSDSMWWTDSGGFPAYEIEYIFNDVPLLDMYKLSFDGSFECENDSDSEIAIQVFDFKGYYWNTIWQDNDSFNESCILSPDYRSAKGKVKVRFYDSSEGTGHKFLEINFLYLEEGETTSSSTSISSNTTETSSTSISSQTSFSSVSTYSSESSGLSTESSKTSWSTVSSKSSETSNSEESLSTQTSNSSTQTSGTSASSFSSHSTLSSDESLSSHTSVTTGTSQTSESISSGSSRSTESIESTSSTSSSLSSLSTKTTESSSLSSVTSESTKTTESSSLSSVTSESTKTSCSSQSTSTSMSSQSTNSSSSSLSSTSSRTSISTESSSSSSSFVDRMELLLDGKDIKQAKCLPCPGFSLTTIPRGLSNKLVKIGDKNVSVFLDQLCLDEEFLIQNGSNNYIYKGKDKYELVVRYWDKKIRKLVKDKGYLELELLGFIIDDIWTMELLIYLNCFNEKVILYRGREKVEDTYAYNRVHFSPNLAKLVTWNSVIVEPLI